MLAKCIKQYSCRNKDNKEDLVFSEGATYRYYMDVDNEYKIPMMGDKYIASLQYETWDEHFMTIDKWK